MIQQIRLVVLIPHAIMKWSETGKKMTEKEKFSPHALPIFGHSPCRDVEYLLVLASRYKSLTRLPFLGLPLVDVKHRNQGSLLTLLTACHSFTEAYGRVSKVKQKMCILRKQRV